MPKSSSPAQVGRAAGTRAPKLLLGVCLAILGATVVQTFEMSVVQSLTDSSAGSRVQVGLGIVGLFAEGSLLVFGVVLPVLGLPLVWLTTRGSPNGAPLAASIVAALFISLGSLFVLMSGATAVAWLFVMSLGLPGAAAGWIMWRVGIRSLHQMRAPKAACPTEHLDHADQAAVSPACLDADRSAVP